MACIPSRCSTCVANSRVHVSEIMTGRQFEMAIRPCCRCRLRLREWTCISSNSQRPAFGSGSHEVPGQSELRAPPRPPPTSRTDRRSRRRAAPWPHAPLASNAAPWWAPLWCRVSFERPACNFVSHLVSHGIASVRRSDQSHFCIDASPGFRRAQVSSVSHTCRLV